MGHYCRICDRSRPNEQFSGRGHRIHVCKKCQRLPRERRDSIERLDELHGFLHQSIISARNVARLKSLTGHGDHQVAELAAMILEIARVLPGKRNRWLKLAQRHRPLFDRTVALLGVEFFQDLLARSGDFESPLWDYSNNTGKESNMPQSRFRQISVPLDTTRQRAPCRASLAQSNRFAQPQSWRGTITSRLFRFLNRVLCQNALKCGAMNATGHRSAETLHAIPLAFARKIFGRHLAIRPTHLRQKRDTLLTGFSEAFARRGTPNGLQRDKFRTSPGHVHDIF